MNLWNDLTKLMKENQGEPLIDLLLKEYQYKTKSKFSNKSKEEKAFENIPQDKLALLKSIIENSLPKAPTLTNEEIMEERRIKAKDSEKTNITPNFGIHLQGSSCYINSTLQALSGLDKFTKFINQYHKEPKSKNSKKKSKKNKSKIENLINAVEYTRNPQISPEAIKKFHWDFVNKKFAWSKASPHNAMDVFEYWMKVIDDHVRRKTNKRKDLKEEEIILGQFEDEDHKETEEIEFRNPFSIEGVVSYESKTEGIDSFYKTVAVHSTILGEGDNLVFKQKSPEISFEYWTKLRNKKVSVISESKNDKTENLVDKEDPLSNTNLFTEKISKLHGLFIPIFR